MQPTKMRATNSKPCGPQRTGATVLTYSDRIVKAQTTLALISARNANLAETKSSTGAVKHRCFLSYHSVDAPEVLAFVEQYGSVFTALSIGVSDSDGDIINSQDGDYIMDQIGSKYLTNSTVTILLVGQCTWSRKFVDWELYSSLRAGKVRTVNGLLAYQLPSVTGTRVAIPQRLTDNHNAADPSKAYARYYVYPSSTFNVQSAVEDAFQARTSRATLIKNTATRRAANASCP